MKQSGFSLIEIIIALLISSFVAMMLYQSFNQTRRVVTRITGLMHATSDILPLFTQLEKDLSGAVAPLVHAQKQTAETGKTEQQSAVDKNVRAAEEKTKKNEADKESESAKKEKHIFKVVLKDNKFESMSFITTNALTVVDESTTHFVRVTYRLVPQANTDQSNETKLFRLLREEVAYEGPASGDQTDKKKKQGRPFELARNLTECTVSLQAYKIDKPEKSANSASVRGVDEKKQSDAKAEQKSKTAQASSSEKNARVAKVKELLTLTTWGNDEQRKKVDQALPEFITIKGVFQSDKATHRTFPFAFEVHIPAAVCADLPEKKSGSGKAEGQQGNKPEMPAATQAFLGALPENLKQALGVQGGMA